MEYFQSYLIILIEISCFLLFYDIFAKSGSEISRIPKFLWIIAMSAVMFGMSYLFENHFIIKELAIIGSLSFGIVILKAENIKNACFVSVLFVFLLVIADFITIAIDTQILSVDTSNGMLVDMLVVLMSKAILLLLTILLRQKSAKRGVYVDDEIEGIRFAAFPFISICIIAVLLSNGFGIQGEGESYFVWCMIFSLLAMNVLMVFYVKDMAEKNYLLQEKRMFELDARGQRTLYRSLEEKIELQRSISHEYKNHLSYMQALLERREYDSLSEYLKKINGEVEHDLDMIDTNNPIINTIVNTKYYEAKTAGAVVVCKINDLSEITMEETDIILLLSNLLNNAIEAIRNSSKEKVLRFKIVLEHEKLLLSVQNSYEGKIKKNEGIYETTKTKDKELHGIGIKNIMRITEKYDGIYTFEHTDKEFHATVIIPNAKTNME